MTLISINICLFVNIAIFVINSCCYYCYYYYYYHHDY